MSATVLTEIVALPLISAATAPKSAPPAGMICCPEGVVTAALLELKLTATDSYVLESTVFSIFMLALPNASVGTTLTVNAPATLLPEI